jgi:hypothetical protein
VASRLLEFCNWSAGMVHDLHARCAGENSVEVVVQQCNSVLLRDRFFWSLSTRNRRKGGKSKGGRKRCGWRPYTNEGEGELDTGWLTCVCSALGLFMTAGTRMLL